jgi:microcompartment protein CcmL/EutN
VQLNNDNPVITAKPNNLAVGCIEVSSIARGLETADGMLKAAKVELLFCSPVCPGKYLILVGGQVAEVNSAVQAGESLASDTLVDSMIIPRIDPQVLTAFSATTQIDEIDAIGMIETFSIASAIIAGDQAVKSAKVKLIEIRLARAVGGKAFVLLTGGVSAVNAAIAAGKEVASQNGLILGTTIIASPHPELVRHLL